MTIAYYKAPVKTMNVLADLLPGETIPIRLFLGGFDLTPTFREVNKKYSVRYYLSLVLIDEGTFKGRSHVCFGGIHVSIFVLYRLYGLTLGHRQLQPHMRPFSRSHPTRTNSMIPPLPGLNDLLFRLIVYLKKPVRKEKFSPMHPTKMLLNSELLLHA